MIEKNWYNMTEAEREEYVNQDYVSPKEILTGNIDQFNDEHSCWPDLIVINTPSRIKSAIIGLWRDGKSKHEIAIYVECSRQYVIEVIGKYYNVNAKKVWLGVGIFDIYFNDINKLTGVKVIYRRGTITQ